MSSVPQIVRRRRARRQQAGSRPVLYGALAFVAVTIGVAMVALGAVLGGGWLAYMSVAGRVPAVPGQLSSAPADIRPTVLLDRSGQRALYQVRGADPGDMIWRSLSELPPYVWQAALAAEDPGFFERPAFSLPALLQTLSDVFLFGELDVADPILLALARQVIVPLYEMPLDHADRVHTDAILIMEMRRRFSREQLLEWFLNTAFYGDGVYGIEAASRYYLDKPATDLTLAEAALLAGIPGAPSLTPYDRPDAAQQRQEAVLDAMVAEHMVDAARADAARGPVQVARALAPTDVIAPHYALLARRQAEAALNAAGYDGARLVSGGGLRITTALDLDLQYQAECVLRTHLIRLSGVDPTFEYATAAGEPCRAAAYLPGLAPEDVGVLHNVSNGALVVTRPDTGEILAYVGSADYWDDSIGGPVDSAQRGYEPGGMIRPFVYLTALSQGFTPATMTLDIPLSLEQSPDASIEIVNADGVYHGPISLRDALVYDAAPPAAQVMNWVGTGETLRTMHSMGITSLVSATAGYGPSLVAEGGEVSLLDLVYSLGVLANGGHLDGVPVDPSLRQPGLRSIDPVAVLRIEDAAGSLLWEYRPVRQDKLDPALAYLMNDMMGDRELRAQTLGMNNVLEIGRPASVYASGSADGRDLWAVGYTPQRVVGVWLGNVDRQPAVHLDALRGPAPVWKAVLRYLQDRDSLPVSDWARPATVVELPVCAVSGLLPTQYCPVVVELFAQGTQPTRQDEFYQMVEINRNNGRRATASTPRDLVEQRVYFAYPREAQEWAAAQGLQGPPTDYDTIGAPPTLGPVAVLEPEPLAYIRGLVDVRGNASLPGFQYYQLAYGAGLNPLDWTQIGERVYVPARGALLGQWDTAGLDGLYSLRLTAVTEDQQVQQSVIQVTVDNTPPQISISAPQAGDEVRVAGLNPVMNVAAIYSDNVGVRQVVYYLDSAPVATAVEPPFSASVVLEALGPHSIWAEAIDAAGNSALSERISFTVVRGN